METTYARRPVAELTTMELGRAGERACAAYLERQGYEVYERNWRCAAGEVDLVAGECPGSRVFVEVKTRLALDGVTRAPECRVDAEKLARYRELVRLYLAAHPEVESVRFDVAGIDVVGESQARIHYVRGVWLGDTL